MSRTNERRASPTHAKDYAERWLRPEIRQLSAYHVPAAAGVIKLDAMENPYPWPEQMVGEWLESIRHAQPNRYPDAGAQELKQALRANLGLEPQASLLLGNGSDELIQIIQLGLAAPGAVVLAPTPTFVMYEMIACFVGAEFVGVPLDENFEIDCPATLAAIEQHQPAVVFLAYPNNPTGNLFDPGAMQEIVASAPGLVVIDEAYQVFAGETWLDGRELPANVVVMRTLSKLGLAGLRLGYLVGDRAWLDEFDKLRLPYNINVLTQISVAFALAHAAVFERQARAIVDQRSRVASALKSLGHIVYPSATNFILFRTAPGRADSVFDRLLQAGVLIKNLHRPGTPLADCLRVTIGTEEENSTFLDALARA